MGDGLMDRPLTCASVLSPEELSGYKRYSVLAPEMMASCCDDGYREAVSTALENDLVNSACVPEVTSFPELEIKFVFVVDGGNRLGLPVGEARVRVVSENDWLARSCSPARDEMKPSHHPFRMTQIRDRVTSVDPPTREVGK